MPPVDDERAPTLPPEGASSSGGMPDPTDALVVPRASALPSGVDVLPPVSARPRRFSRKRLLLGVVVLALLGSLVAGGLQLWITLHLPPQLAVSTVTVPFVPPYEPTPFYPETNPTMELLQLISGPDGNVYFLPDFGNWIGRMTPDGQASRISLPPLDPPGSFITWGGLSQGGGSIWASELWGGLWRVDLSSGSVTAYGRNDPHAEWWNGAATQDGSVWLEVVDDQGLFNERALALGQFHPQTGQLGTFPVSPTAGGWGPLVQATDGRLWSLTAQVDAAAGITTSIGVNRFDPQTGSVRTVRIKPTFPTFVPTVPPGTVDGNGNPVTSFGIQFPDVTFPPAVEAGPPVADSPMLTPAADGGVWVLCEGHAADGFISYPVHIAPTGRQTIVLAPHGGSVIAMLPDTAQTLWVVYYDATISPHFILGQLSANGGIMPVGRLTNSQPRYLAVGAGHQLWMTTAWSANTLERVDLPVGADSSEA